VKNRKAKAEGRWKNVKRNKINEYWDSLEIKKREKEAR